MLTHADIEGRDLVDDYVRGTLSAEEAREFEEHFFACDECFERVLAVERFAAAVRQAARHGDLTGHETSRRGVFADARSSWMAAAAAIAVVVAGWLALARIPELRQELASERLVSQDRIRRLEQEQGRLTTELTRERAAAATRPSGGDPSANVPVAILETLRGDAIEEVAVGSGARDIVIWIDSPPAAAGQTYVLRIAGADGREVAAIESLRPNRHGAIVGSVAAAAMPPGSYVARLYAADSPRLLREFRLAIRRAD